VCTGTPACRSGNRSETTTRPRAAAAVVVTAARGDPARRARGASLAGAGRKHHA
jgi:hypothetical protein